MKFENVEEHMIRNLLNEWKLKNAGEDMAGKLAAIDNPQSTTTLWRNMKEDVGMDWTIQQIFVHV